AVMRRLLVRIGQREEPRISPRPAEQRDAERIPAVADEAARYGDLRQPGERALLARARLAAKSLQAALVRVPPPVVGRIQQRVERLPHQQAHKETGEAAGVGDERGARLP